MDGGKRAFSTMVDVLVTGSISPNHSSSSVACAVGVGERQCGRMSSLYICMFVHVCACVHWWRICLAPQTYPCLVNEQELDEREFPDWACVCS